MRGEGYITVGLDETPEAYIVAAIAFGHIRSVVERFDATSDGCVAAVRLSAELREDDILARRAGERTLAALAVRHDCEANPVPYVSDGPLGHGWECGRCGAFLQAG